MRTLLMAICLSVLPVTAAEVYAFTPLGPQTVSGPGGVASLTGWGYSIQNQSSSDWLVTTGLIAGAVLHATPQLLFDFPDVAPGATVTVPYNPGPSASGLYQLVWDANTPAGFVNSGSFTLEAQWWSGDSLAGGEFLATAPSMSKPYSTATTPVPGTTGILAISILLLGATRAFRCWRGVCQFNPPSRGLSD